MDQPQPNRQTRKRLATRQRISDLATRLFFERGFDAVTIDEIAEAADVSRMTVFNHFARKEDLLFDLDQQGRDDLLAALHLTSPAIPPLEALRRFAHAAVAEQRPYVRFFGGGADRFMATVQGSEALKARARAIRDELTTALAAALAAAVHRPHPDPAASLAASMLISSWAVALLEAHRAFQQHHDLPRAHAILLDLVDRGVTGVQAALSDTPYR